MKERLNFSVELEMRGKDIFSLFSSLIDLSGAVNKEEALSLIRKREELGPTAIGNGIAVPHAKIPGLAHPAVAIGTLSEPVAYGGDDIMIIIMMLLPEGGSASDVELLSSLVSAVSSESRRRRVLEAKSRQEVLEVFLG